MTMSYIILIAVSTVIGLGAQFYVNQQIKKYQSVPTSTGLSGQQAAANMLAFHNVTGVPITQGEAGQDFSIRAAIPSPSTRMPTADAASLPWLRHATK